MSSTIRVLSALCIALAALVPVAQAQKAYRFQEQPLFHPHPNPALTVKKPWNVRNLGPVGIGIDLTGPHFTMVISNVEPGSPAARTGKLKKGQIIESINGRTLKDIDPRIILGNIITQAEASDGKVRLRIRNQGEVVVRIPVMGSYSDTWPLNCSKSDRIVRKLADKLATLEEPGWGAVLFLLSTGEEKDLEVVRRWMSNLDSIGSINWHYGYSGIGVCEYYLRTGDRSVLPAIRDMVKDLEDRMYTGGWSGRGVPANAAFTYSTGSGQLHAAGVHCFTVLLMARMCGVEVDEATLQEVLTQFFRFAGRGSVPYGNGLPENGFTDNGKTSGLAVAMEAAVRLSGQGEQSLYAQARDTSATKAFYATNWFHAAHTGGGIGEIWHHAAVSMVKEKRPAQYRSYFDTRQWVMDLSRRHDGTIGIAGMTDRYDESATDGNIGWGTYFALTYTLPRKQLQLFGAPRSKWAKTHPLPERPWGTPADDDFLRTDPVQLEGFTEDMLLRETVEEHSSLRVMNRINPGNADEKLLIHYLHHPEFGLRTAALRAAINHQRFDFVVPCMKSDDARMRYLGALAISGIFKGSAVPNEKLTPEMFDLLGRMIEEPNESWWVLQEAIRAFKRAPKERIAGHKDRLLELLDAESPWVQAAAVRTLSEIATDPAHYREVFPQILGRAAAFNVDSASHVGFDSIKRSLEKAPKEVRTFAAPLLKETYLSVPGDLKGLNGTIITKAGDTVRERVRHSLVLVPGGGKFALRIPKATLASTRSGRKEDMFHYDGFRKDDRFAGTWLFLSNIWKHPVSDEDVRQSLTRALKKDRERRDRAAAGKGRYKVSRLTLNPDGSGSRMWTGDTIIKTEKNEAVKMELRRVDGRRCLLVELGDFPAKTPPEWHCSYALYVLESDAYPNSPR